MSPSRVITLGWRGISRRGITRRRRGITSGGIAPSAWCHAVSANFQHPTHYARSHALLAAWHSWAHARTAARQRSALRARAGLGARRARAARHSGDERARVSRRVLGIERRVAGGGIARGRRAVELRRRGGSVQCHRRPRRGRQRARAASAACWRGRAPRRRDGHASPPRRRRGALVGRRALATWRNEPMKAPHRAAQRGRRPPPPPPRVHEHLHHHSASGARPPSPRERAAKQYACARRAHASGIRHALHAEARERSARACVAEAARRRSDGSMAS